MVYEPHISDATVNHIAIGIIYIIFMAKIAPNKGAYGVIISV